MMDLELKTTDFRRKGRILPDFLLKIGILIGNDGFGIEDARFLAENGRCLSGMADFGRKLRIFGQKCRILAEN